MKLSDIKGEAAIDAMADLMEPLALIFADPDVKLSAQNNEPQMITIKKILKSHKKEVIQILAILDGEKPELYEVNLLSLPMKLLELINDPEIQNLFTSQGQKTE